MKKFEMDNIYEGKNQAMARAAKLRGGNNQTKITKRKARSGLNWVVWWRSK